jgi:hypothetical protein
MIISFNKMEQREVIDIDYHYRILIDFNFAVILKNIKQESGDSNEELLK